ncbi:MAG: DUF4159 domain-containing protein [Magnetococcus sp. WYHC-3]
MKACERERLRRVTSTPWPSLMCASLGIMATGLVYGAARLPGIVDLLVMAHPALRVPFIDDGIFSLTDVVSRCGLAVSGICFAASIVGFVRRTWALRFVRNAYMACWMWLGVYVYAVYCATAVPLAHNLKIGGVLPTAHAQFFLRFDLLWPAFAMGMALALLYLFSWRRAAIAVYSGEDQHAMPPAAGDRFIENLRTNGRDPPFRRGLCSSVASHLLVIVVIPWLLSLRGCVTPCREQAGSGKPVVNVPPPVVKIKPVKRPTKHFLVDPRALISFIRPTLDDSKLPGEVEMESRYTYKADPSRLASPLGTPNHGNTGAGNGNKGGWPDGMQDACLRFIRMQYDGAGWDDGMDAVSRADLNLLDTVHQLTGFNVSSRPESHAISLLRKYSKGYAPPFVYMTGSGNINVSAGDSRIMRDYLLGGGLLFASAASPQWHGSFQAFIGQVFPGQRLLEIPDDDPILRFPYSFENGAPPLWHHGGFRVLGIKHEGRWVVFYHPGDIHDAWKTGHSGLNEALADDATKTGINVIYYAITRYLEKTRASRE